MATNHQLEAWERIKKSPLFFASFWTIVIPGKGKQKFEPYTGQKELLEDFQSERGLCILKARQIGLSTLVAFYCCWYALTHPDAVIIIISRKQTEANKLLKKVKTGYNSLPMWIQELVPVKSDNLSFMSFANGAEIYAVPSRENAARGDSGDLIIADEFAFLNDPAEAWRSMEPASDVGGKIIILSTSNGPGDFFWSLYNDSLKGLTKLKPVFLNCFFNSNRDESWYREKELAAESQDEQAVKAFHIEYPLIEDHCWYTGESLVFDVNKMPTENEMVAPQFQVEVLSTGQFIESSTPNFNVWEIPEDGVEYTITVDVSGGKAGADYTAMFVGKHGDITTLVEHTEEADDELPSSKVTRLTREIEVVAIFHMRIPPEEAISIAYALGEYYNMARLVVERNNMGAEVADGLKNLNYKNLYYTTTAKGLVKYAGLQTGANKELMMIALRRRIYKKAARFYCSETLAELRAYRYKSSNGKRTMGAPAGMFDDRVMTFAMLAFVADQMFVPPPVEQQETAKLKLTIEDYTMGDFEDMVMYSGRRVNARY